MTLSYRINAADPQIVVVAVFVGRKEQEEGSDENRIAPSQGHLYLTVNNGFATLSQVKSRPIGPLTV